MVKKALVIVESPSKAKTIQKYLGKTFIVKASVGHIKDLPKSKLGVDPKKGFEPLYQTIPSKVKIIEELKKAAHNVPILYLATDPDREGEAIAWHIQDELKTRGKKIYRILFNAITQQAILDAMNQPQNLNADKYEAQKARRVLDRLVGYKISPLLWDKVKRGISAGRVQSVALRLIVERETEIKAFQSQEYWEIHGQFKQEEHEFTAKLFKIQGQDPQITQEVHAQKLIKSLENCHWTVSLLEKKQRIRKPDAPFITSRLQQEAARKLGFSAKKTMMLAQRLYEGMDLGKQGTHGLITYMRTDSVHTDPQALNNLRDFIQQTYGSQYLPEKPLVYRSKKSAQQAHEAIRPTSLQWSPESLQNELPLDEWRLYQLIWNRFVSSQMTSAIYDQTILEIRSAPPSQEDPIFRVTGSIMKFPGFTTVYMESTEEETQESEKTLKIPMLKLGDSVLCSSLTPSQHFTQPPARYTDASLIRDLEEKGIGRPSTYATILSNLQERDYVEKRNQRYFPSELGMVVTELLVASFPEILNTEFTASMENQLDDIEEGKAHWKKVLSHFWKPFEKTLETAQSQMKDLKRQEVPTSLMCDRCGHPFMIRWGKLGSFLACSHYPECQNTQDFKKDDEGQIVILPKELTDKKCQKCQNPMVIKQGKFGKFLACSHYPHCKFTQAITTGIACPQCPTGEIAQKRSKYGRFFYSCNQWPTCHFAMWYPPLSQPCPQCHFPIMIAKTTKRAGLTHECIQKTCGYREIIELPAHSKDKN